MRTLLVVLADDISATAATLALYAGRGVRTVVHSQNEEVRQRAALLGVAHVETADPYDLIKTYEPQVVVCDHNGPLRETKLAVYRTGIPDKFYLTATEGATVVENGAHAAQDHYYRDLDRTNAPLPENDLFAGLSEKD
ncbi:hypothetical protein [Lentzea cavernae]|uniref:hypothetical protein n=1 Tax=Lentzea cavernae TaxID=2020703 RepID=UPI00174884DE|nr:hypothetical protein [Lentzea cavernae]